MTHKKTLEYADTGFRVLLLNFPVYTDEGETFPDVGPMGLHRVIARELLARPGLLTGRQLTFLRAHADLTRSECARRLKVTRRTLITWEDSGGKRIPAPALKHGALRMFFAKVLFPRWSLPETSSQLPVAVPRSPLVIDFLRYRVVLQPPPESAKSVPESLQRYLFGSRLETVAA